MTKNFQYTWWRYETDAILANGKVGISHPIPLSTSNCIRKLPTNSKYYQGFYPIWAQYWPDAQVSIGDLMPWLCWHQFSLASGNCPQTANITQNFETNTDPMPAICKDSIGNPMPWVVDGNVGIESVWHQVPNANLTIKLSQEICLKQQILPRILSPIRTQCQPFAKIALATRCQG